MAIGWLSVLQWVPWGDVIANAPKVADAAKKLWKTARKTGPGDTTAPMPRTAPTSLTSLQAQLNATEEQVAQLHEQMLASSELIKALAEQNTQLISRIEKNRIRMRWFGSVALLALILAVTGLVLILQR